MKIKYEMLSEQGLKRPTNQDRVTAHTNENMSLFAIADGMGGHSDGEYASQRVVDVLDELWIELSSFYGDIQIAVDKVISKLDEVNAEIYKYAADRKIICGSTVSILLICNDLFAVINIGDSPVYYSDRKNFVHASTEHSYGIIMQKTTLIAAEDIDEHRRNRLIQAIGVKERIYPSVRTGAVKDKTAFLLCSDGISRYFTEKQIRRRLSTALNKTNPVEVVSILKEIVYKKGAEDNLSVISICAYTPSSDGQRTNCNKLMILLLIITLILAAWLAVNIMILK